MLFRSPWLRYRSRRRRRRGCGQRSSIDVLDRAGVVLDEVLNVTCRRRGRGEIHVVLVPGQKSVRIGKKEIHCQVLIGDARRQYGSRIEQRVPLIETKRDGLNRSILLDRQNTALQVPIERRIEESDREGIRVVIDLKKDSFPKKILNQLYKMTPLQSSFSFNMLALIDGIQPRILGLQEMLEEFIKHRQIVVRRRTEYELRKAKERAHILEGYKIALEIGRAHV